MELHTQNTSYTKIVQQQFQQANNIQLSRTQPNIQRVSRQLQQQPSRFFSQPQLQPSMPRMIGLQQQPQPLHSFQCNEFVVSPHEMAPQQFHQQPLHSHNAVTDKRFMGSPRDQNGMTNQPKKVTDSHDPSYEELQSAWKKYLPHLDNTYKNPELATKVGELKVYVGVTSKALRLSSAEYNTLSQDQKQKIVKRVRNIKALIDKYNNRTASSRQQPQSPGSQSQWPPDQQQKNMKLQRSEPAAASPRIPAQHIISSSEATKINPAHAVRSMDQQTRHQMFQQKKIRDVSKLGQIVWCPPGILQQQHSAVNSPQTSGQAATQLHWESRASPLATVVNSPHPAPASVKHSEGPAKDAQTLRSNIVSPRQHRQPPPQPPSRPASQSQLRRDQQQMNTMLKKSEAAPTSPRLPAQHIPSNSKANKMNPARSLRAMDEQTRHQMFQKQNISEPIQKTFQKNISDVNGPNLAQVVQTGPGILQQLHSVGQLRESPHANVNSPQTSRQASSQLHRENRASPLSTVASDPNGSCTSSSLSPSSLMLDSTTSPSPAVANVEDSQGPAKDAQNLSGTTNENQDSSNMLPAPLMQEVFPPEENQKGISDESPLQRLLDAVKSMSNKALCATAEDIGSIMDMDTVDGICGSPVASSRRMKRHFGVISASADVSASEGLQGLSCRTNDLESPTATHRTKMPKLQHNTTNLLLDEIKETNKRLVETTLDVLLDSTETTSSADFGEGTMVRFLYTPVGVGRNIELRKSDSRLLPLFCVQLFVPADYRKSTPLLLNDEDSLCGLSEAVEQEYDLTKKVNMRFSSCLHELSQHPSLKEMARRWDDCARSVLTEFAASTGGGSFSTKYGKWENCI